MDPPKASKAGFGQRGQGDGELEREPVGGVAKRFEGSLWEHKTAGYGATGQAPPSIVPLPVESSSVINHVLKGRVRPTMAESGGCVWLL